MQTIEKWETERLTNSYVRHARYKIQSNGLRLVSGEVEKRVECKNREDRQEETSEYL